MNKKIMELIDLAMQFEGKRLVANVMYGSNVKGVSVWVLEDDKMVYSEIVYLDWKDVDKKLDVMKAELEKYLNQSLKEVV